MPRHRDHACQAEPRRRGAAFACSIVVIAALVGCAGDARQALTDRGAARDGVGSRAPHLDAGSAPFAPFDRPPSAESLALIPPPRSVTKCVGSLALDAATEIVIGDNPEERAIGDHLAQWLGVPASSVRAIPPGAPGPAHAVVLRLDGPPRARGEADPPAPQRDPAFEPPGDLEDEAYSLDVTPERAVLRARHPAGLFYGAQTLAQLASSRPLLPAPPPRLASATSASAFGSPTLAAAPAPVHASLASAAPRPLRILPCVHIDDAPRHRVRAMHLDVARHFFSQQLVERYVDILAFYRFNVFHWHLTDDQGFRLAISSHPELTQVGAKRIEDGREHAGWYTQDQARAVVAFAKERFITVVPEIEMPGHARAILASHPELSCTGKKQGVPSTWGVFDDVLCAGNEQTFALLGDVLRETTDVFPSHFVHVGGDEVPKKRWNECPKCRARMKKEQLTSEQLQGTFMKRAGDLLASRGRRMVAWDEALDVGFAKDGVVTAWRGAQRGRAAAIAGHDVVLAPHDTTYFNFWQSHSRTEPGQEGYVPWTKVLAFDPQPAGLDATQAAHILGGEGALWTEHVRTSDDLDALLLPRLAALSEALWRGGAAASASFASRFMVQRRLLDDSGVRYFVEPPSGLRPRKLLVDQAALTLVSPSLHPDGVVRFTLDGSDPGPTSPIYTEPIVLRAATSVAACLVLPGGRVSDVVRGQFEPTSPHPAIQPSMDPDMLREGVFYRYFEGDFHRLPDFARLVPKHTGRMNALSFDGPFRPDRFAVVYEAWIRVPEDGVYRFVAGADDGVALDVDGVRVVEDDGEHASREDDGEIALERGPHTVRIAYFQGVGGKELHLECEGPSLALGPCRLLSP